MLTTGAPQSDSRKSLQVVYGTEMDGYRPPHPLNSAGELTVGPSGMLDLLETRLGLKGNYLADSVRVVQYLQRLRDCDDDSRFYSRSLKVDELAVARTLLGWRDSWIAAGWNGCASANDSKRLRDLAEVELFVGERLSPGMGDRLWSVCRQLEKGIRPDIKVLLTEKQEELPIVWRKIFSFLPTELPFDDSFHPPAALDSDLARLQKALLTNEACKLVNDGSVLLVTANAAMTLAKSLPDLFSSAPKMETTIVDGGGSEILDLALQGVDLPAVGLCPPSRWRPHLQVLPLALSLLWKPLDPYRLLEFLVNPVAPLPASCRRKLARVVAEYPGTGGLQWQECVEEIRARAVELAGGDQTAGEKIIDSIDSWLAPEDHDPESGVPLSRAAEKCAQVARWAAAQVSRENLNKGSRDLFFAASSQAALAARLLDDMTGAGIKTITRLQLNRLLDQVTARGTIISDCVAECGHVHLVPHPGACIAGNDRVIWWNFIEPVLPARWPWNVAEIEQLQANGAVLDSTEVLLQRQAAKWLRPVFAAAKQLIFVVPQAKGRESVQVHPLWSRIRALTNDTVTIIDIDSELQAGQDASPLALRTEIVRRVQLPAPVRWWHLADCDSLGKRETESYSSLNDFLFSPYQWVLKYKAKIRAGRLARIEDDNRQKGNLLHHLLEKLFISETSDWRTISRSELDGWVDKNFYEILRTEGANYLLPGKTVKRELLFEQARRSTWGLLTHLRAAEVERVEIERKVNGKFIGGGLGGYIDMLVTNSAGREAVLDLKFGSGKYKVEELENNLHLQLAVYAQLRRTESGCWPAQAYYILTEGRMLAQDNDFFPEAEVCKPLEAEDVASLWSAFELTWKWRRSQLDDGLIEVTVSGSEADDGSKPPDGGLGIGEHNDRFNDYATLTGWREKL